MTIEDGIIQGSTITFQVSGVINAGSIPLLGLLIRQARRRGLSVTLDFEHVDGIEWEAARYLVLWQAEGVAVAETPAVIQ